jgi:hypothetical protein
MLDDPRGRSLYELTQDFVVTPGGSATLTFFGNFFPDYFRVSTLLPSDTIVDLSNVAVFLPDTLGNLWTQLLQTTVSQVAGVADLCVPYVGCFGSVQAP